MNITNQCTLALQLAEHADELSDPNKFLLLLQQCFIVVFKGDAVLNESQEKPTASPSDIASREEEKLMLVRAIQAFHTKGSARHGSFFRSAEYHNHAALFIHELLNSLSGNSKDWFRELQFHSLKACQTIISVLSSENVRNCLPGIVSAAVRYMKRAHHGKDCVAVRLSAIDLLHQCLKMSFSTTPDPQWTRKATVHLSRSLGAVLSPTALVQSPYEGKALMKCRMLVEELLTTPVLSIGDDSGLFRELIGSFLVLDNMCHLHRLGVAEVLANDDDEGNEPGLDSEIKEENVSTGNVQTTFSSHPALERVFHSSLAQQFVVDTLHGLRGVSLLHATTTVARLPFLRSILICDEGDRGNSETGLFDRIIQRIVRLVGVEMSASDLYTYRQPRRFPAGVVDECLESIAHSLAEMPYVPNATPSAPSAGEQLTNALLAESHDVLSDWDLYALHPATVYVLSRLIVWQFKPIPSYLDEFFSTNRSEFPYPTDFISCNILEQLWSVIALPHLWCIEEDEELCSAQQTSHRRLMASIIIRVLELIAVDVVSPAMRMSVEPSPSENVGPPQSELTFEDREAGRISFERLCAITLYPIMEKAGIPGAVHDSVMHCLDSFAAVSGETAPLVFFTQVSDYIVDEASRAVKERYLRTKVTSVLSGTIKFLSHQVIVQKQGPKAASLPTSDEDGSHFLFSTTSYIALPQLIRHRLSPVAVRAALSRMVVDEKCIAKCADFVSVIVSIATSAAQEALEEGDDVGSKSLLTLMRDALDIAVLLNYSAPLEVLKEDDERETTSANMSVKKLQYHVIGAIRTFQTHALRSQAAVSLGVEVVLRGLTSFLSSSTAIRSSGLGTSLPEEPQSTMQPSESTSEQEKTKKESEEVEEEQEECSPSIFRSRPPREVPWFLENEDGSVSSVIVLPRNILPMVYQTYVPLLSLLKEPVGNFVTSASAIGQRSRVEQRHLMEIRITDPFFAGLTGLHALLLLAVEFLQHRYITEVLPAVLVWYERTLLPTIPTPLEVRAKQLVRDFFEVLRVHCDERKNIEEWCALVEQNVSLFHSKRAVLGKKDIFPQTGTTASGYQRDYADVVHLTREDLYIGGSASNPQESSSSSGPRNAVSQFL